MLQEMASTGNQTIRRRTITKLLCELHSSVRGKVYANIVATICVL